MNKNDSDFKVDYKLELVYEKINLLAKNLEIGLHDLKGISSQLSQDMSDLKRSITENGRVEVDEKINLKFLVAEGN